MQRFNKDATVVKATCCSINEFSRDMEHSHHIVICTSLLILANLSLVGQDKGAHPKMV